MTYRVGSRPRVELGFAGGSIRALASGFRLYLTYPLVRRASPSAPWARFDLVELGRKDDYDIGAIAPLTQTDPSQGLYLLAAAGTVKTLGAGASPRHRSHRVPLGSRTARREQPRARGTASRRGGCPTETARACRPQPPSDRSVDRRTGARPTTDRPLPQHRTLRGYCSGARRPRRHDGVLRFWRGGPLQAAAP